MHMQPSVAQIKVTKTTKTTTINEFNKPVLKDPPTQALIKLSK